STKCASTSHASGKILIGAGPFEAAGGARGSGADAIASQSCHRDQSLDTPKNRFYRRTGLLLDPRQVLGAAEALGVELVDVLGARRARREPAAVGDDLDAADRIAAAGRRGQDSAHRLPGELADIDVLGGDAAERRLLGGRGVDVDALVDRLAEGADEVAVLLAGVAANPC